MLFLAISDKKIRRNDFTGKIEEILIGGCSQMYWRKIALKFSKRMNPYLTHFFRILVHKVPNSRTFTEPIVIERSILGCEKLIDTLMEEITYVVLEAKLFVFREEWHKCDTFDHFSLSKFYWEEKNACVHKFLVCSSMEMLSDTFMEEKQPVFLEKERFELCDESTLYALFSIVLKWSD